MVWCPTWSKNLGRTLLLTCASGRKHNSAILKKILQITFFSGSGHESRSGHHAFDCFIRTRYKKYVRSYIQWTQSLAHHASQFLLHYHTYIQKVEEKNKSYLLLLPNLSCNFGLWREFLLFLPYVTIILPPKKTTIGQNHLWSQIGLFSNSYLYIYRISANSFWGNFWIWKL